MNPGLTEEAGLTARTLVESFKSAPAVFAVLLFNVAFMGVIAYLSHSNHSRWDRESARWSQLIENTMKMCQAPAGYKLESDTSKPVEP